MRHIILHGHIFKNAGTTLDWSLRNNFGNGFLDHREDTDMLEQGGKELERLVKGDAGLCAISSHHMTRHTPNLPGVAFLSVYLLRHPLARIRSVYEFERAQQADTPGAIAAKEKSFSSYVDWRMRPDVRRTIRNYQTLYLAGHHELASDADIASRHFAAAVEQLREATLVGVVELYDESMVVLEESLREFYPEIDLSYDVPHNVSSNRRPGSDDDRAVADVLSELGDLQRKVIDHNSFDLALYQLACQQLQSRIECIEDFPTKLLAFRSRIGQKSDRI